MKLSLERVSQILASSLNISIDELFAAFHVAGEQDFDDVLQFRRDYFQDFPGWDDTAYLRWRFDFSGDASGQANAFWILRVKGEILGVIGIESFELMVNGRIMRACHPLDLLVKPSLNGLGIGAWLSMAISRKCPILMVVGSSGESLNLIKRIFHPISYYQTWKLPISLKGTVYRITRSRILALAASLVFDRVMCFRRHFRLSSYLNTSFSARPIGRFGDEINNWGVHFSRARIFRHRSSQFLNWRFLDNPCQQYSALGLYRKDSLVAYAIYFMTDSQNNRQKEAVIADFFWDEQAVPENDPDELIKSMLAVTVRELVAKGAKLIELKMIARELPSALTQLGFHCRGEGDIFALMTRDPEANRDLSKSEYWLLTAADTHDDGL